MRRPLMVAALVVTTGGLLGALPSVAACSTVADEGFGGRLSWRSDGSFLTNHRDHTGIFDPDTGTFRPLVAGVRDVEISPDLAHGVRSIGTDARDAWNSCKGGYGDVAAFDASTGALTVLMPGAATAIGSSPRHVAFTHVDAPGVTLYAWGAWDTPIRVPLANADVGYGPADEPFFRKPPHLLAFDPEGRHLLVFGEGRFGVIVDVETLAARPFQVYSDAPVEAVAFSHDGARAALATTSEATAFGQLHLGELDAERHEFRLVGGARDVAAIRGLAWSEGGLAVAYASERPYTGERDGFLRAHPDAPNLTRAHERPLDGWSRYTLAWAPDGRALALGTNGRLTLLDPQLRTLATHEIQRVEGEPLHLERRTADAAPAPDERRAPIPADGPAGVALVLAAAAHLRRRG